MYYPNIKNRIECYENIDRYVTERMLEDTFKNNLKEINYTPITASTDLNMIVTDKKGNEIVYDIEVKERNKDIERFKYLELRKDKLERMLKCSHSKHKLIYIVLVNKEIAVVYDIRKLNWDEIEIFNWPIRKTQVDDESGYAIFPTYQIPIEKAVYTKKIDNYYKDYANN